MKIRSMNNALIVGFIILCAGSMAMACWAPPPDIVWGTSNNGKFEFKRENLTAHITIYNTGKRDAPIWDATVPGFSRLFSMIVLADAGDLMLHVRSNHQVSKLTDTAILVFKKDGSSAKLEAKYFIDKLVVPAGLRVSTSPNFMWLKKFEALTKESFTLINAKDENKKIILKNVKTSKTKKRS